eukprot:TRINITY_DN17967_c0_g1_i1.p1 TRINITY_DN17967_c0_g1~~TRINITY_DN17967_c0_g1_i1.p1  ORF type:complete len:538 (-),score=162.98 TRINITY_DN17967_c0_g1_i1:53-1639(-)
MLPQAVLDKVHDSKGFIAAEPERSVIKACRHDSMPPKEKHLVQLVRFASGHPGNVTDLAQALERRLSSTMWQVAVCSLICYHRIFREVYSPPRLLMFLKNHHDVFQSVKASSLTPVPQEYFAECYASYLSCKVQTYGKLNKLLDVEPIEFFTKSPVDDKIVYIETFLQELQVLVKCNCSQMAGSQPWNRMLDPITMTALAMLVQESNTLYRLLNVCLLSLLDKYFQMPLDMARRIVGFFEGFVTCTQQLNDLYGNCRSFMPKLGPLALPRETLLPSLKSYIATLEKNGGTGVDAVPAQEPLVLDDVPAQEPLFNILATPQHQQAPPQPQAPQAQSQLQHQSQPQPSAGWASFDAFAATAPQPYSPTMQPRPQQLPFSGIPQPQPQQQPQPVPQQQQQQYASPVQQRPQQLVYSGSPQSQPQPLQPQLVYSGSPQPQLQQLQSQVPYSPQQPASPALGKSTSFFDDPLFNSLRPSAAPAPTAFPSPQQQPVVVVVNPFLVGPAGAPLGAPQPVPLQMQPQVQPSLFGLL